MLKQALAHKEYDDYRATITAEIHCFLRKEFLAYINEKNPD
jgi:hypothetical protein